MKNSETEHLVSMANDIAANLGFRADADEQIADHIKRFWAPRMRRLLLEYAAGNGEGLSPDMAGALEKLRD
jgi:formate dehydrogenase subunit delta